MLGGGQPAASLAGLKIAYCDSQGTPVGAVSCFDRLIAQKVNVILDQGIDTASLTASIAKANSAGIPIITSSTQDISLPLPNGTVAGDNFEFYFSGGQLPADFAIVQSNKKVDALIITSSDAAPAQGQVAAMQGEFTKYCPQTCKTTVVDVPIPDWATRIGTVTSSSLLADPGINYIIPLYDEEATFIIPAVHTANAQNRVKVISFNASTGILDYIKNGDVLVADPGQSIRWSGWAAIDQALRVLVGQKGVAALTDPKVPVRLFDSTNVGSLDLKNPDSWYGQIDLEAHYKTQWGL